MNVGLIFGILFIILDGIWINLVNILMIVVMIILIKIEFGNLIVYKIIVIMILNIVKSIGGLVKCFNVINVDLFLIIIFEFCKFINVMNNFIFVEIVIFIW